jgi:pimeloyl-ACP methyl ester carboxylesterase
MTRTGASRRACGVALLAAILVLTGCGPVYSAKADKGIVFYCPGAGNIDFGDAGLRKGLEAAGFAGEVASYAWTISLNPAIDQTVRVNAKLRARILSRIIEDYIRKYPGRPVHVVGLSAGTGIALWALEGMKESFKVDSVVLLSSSLYHEYDVSQALRRVKGRIYNYYSSNDAVLAGPMKIFGTIDGRFGEDGAGSVGLRHAAGRDRVVNIPWKPDFATYGYNGGHTDSTTAPFVRAVLSKHLLAEPSPAAHAADPVARKEPTSREDPTAAQP